MQIYFNDPQFVYNFSASVLWAVLTIVVGILLFVPTAFLIRLKVPQFRSPVEFITLLPFVIPAHCICLWAGADLSVILRS